MADRSHREVNAEEWRALAQRARRLAGNLLDGPDRNLLLDYAAELDDKAAGRAGPAADKTSQQPGPRPPPRDPGSPNEK